MILSCSNINKSFGTDVILKDVSFHINEHEKAAIVGINGAGKSTLLKIIVGELSADSGSVVIAKSTTVGYLSQQQDLTPGNTIWDEVLSVKSEAGRNIRRAYLEHNRGELGRYRFTVLPELLNRVRSLHEIHRKIWFAIYKPFGWDIIDMRYGSLEARITSAVIQLGSYLDGETESIEELEHERLFFNGEAGTLHWCNRYGKIVSPSRIDPMA